MIKAYTEILRNPRAILDRRFLAHFLTFALVFVWSIPGTIALRTALLVAALAVAASCRKIRLQGFARRQPSVSLVAIVLLLSWLLFQALLISQETAWALREMRGQLLPALAACSLGALMCHLDEDTADTRGSTLWTGIALVFASQSAIAVGQSVWYWVENGELLRQLVPLTGGKLEMSYVANLMLAILTVDLFFRAVDHPRLLRIPVAGTMACILIGLVANHLAGSRNGILGTAFLVVSATGLLLFDGRKRIGTKKTIAIALGLVLGVVVFSTSSYRSDPRWRSFAETTEIAINIDEHKFWFDPGTYPLPLLGNGQPVDESAYLRVAWLAAGVRLIKDDPWGVGYGRNAFVRALRQQGYLAKVGHAHSGFVDLLSGGGIPAIVLWLTFVGSMLVAGWRSFASSRSPKGLLLILLVSGFTGRMLVESISRDHMLQIFFFLIGALLPIVNAAPRSPRANS